MRNVGGPCSFAGCPMSPHDNVFLRGARCPQEGHRPSSFLLCFPFRCCFLMFGMRDSIMLLFDDLCLVPSDADEASLNVSICLLAYMAMWGVVRLVVLSLANVRACEWYLGCFCWLAPCLCIERSNLHPFHGHLLGVHDWFLCCLPTKRYSCG